MSSREPVETAASQALKRALSPRLTQAELAAKLGVTQQAVSSWAQGRTTPSAEYMAKIEDLLQIPMRDWAPRVAAPKEEQSTGTDGR